MAASRSSKDKFFENVVNPYLREVMQHPQVIQMHEGVLHIRDVQGPKGTGTVEARLEAMEQDVFRCKGMVECGLNANHLMIADYTRDLKVDGKSMKDIVFTFNEQINFLESQIYDIQNQVFEYEVTDISLNDYLAVTSMKHYTFLPHSAGRYSAKRFRKAQCPIIERLTNSLMMHGRNNGKKIMAVRIIKHTMEIIHLLTDANPIQIIVDAIINRVNQAIYLLTTGARESAFRNVKTIAECLADELINAAKGSSNSYAIKKKDEIERVAKANR
ncbi:40S ribosomal protein S5-1 [Triticum urartu]|uniref:Small ribosomal subunit protein uS7c n=1 Tax=Triticum urartu TaxID=4572 RepID=M8B4A0_TRIUA|nr:40S ribosomal protein S5-1 [Triticum urartu]